MSDLSTETYASCDFGVAPMVEDAAGLSSFGEWVELCRQAFIRGDELPVAKFTADLIAELNGQATLRRKAHDAWERKYLKWLRQNPEP